MGANGATFNWVIARGVAIALLREENLEHIIGKEKGQISISKSWIVELMGTHQLVPRIGGHDAQFLPINWEELCLRIIVIVCYIYNFVFDYLRHGISNC